MILATVVATDPIDLGARGVVTYTAVGGNESIVWCICYSPCLH